MKSMQPSAAAIEKRNRLNEKTHEMAEIEIRLPAFEIPQSGKESMGANDVSFNMLAFDSLPWSLENLNRISVRQTIKTSFLLRNAWLRTMGDAGVVTTL